MNKWEREQQEDLQGAPAIGEDPHAPLPGAATVTTSPAHHLATTFGRMWQQRVTPKHPEWKTRGMAKGMAVGYIRTQLLEAAGASPEHVEALFTAFFDELLDPTMELNLGPRQTGWKLFCGWWPNVDDVVDPALERQRKAEYESMVESGVVLSDAARMRENAAWDRIIAAREAGLAPDPEDYHVAGIPLPTRRFRRGA